MSGFSINFKLNPVFDASKFKAITDQIAKGTKGAVNVDIKSLAEATKYYSQLKNDYNTNLKTVKDINNLMKVGTALTKEQETAYANAKESLGTQAKTLQQLKKAMAETTKDTKNFEGSIKGAGIAAQGLQKAFAFNQIVQSIQLVTGAFEQFLGPYREFDKQLKKIGTLGVKNFEDFRSKAIELAADVPDTVAGVTEAVYNAISAGAINVDSNGIADVAGGMKFIETSSKLAVAGLTDTNSAVKSLSANISAYGDSFENASKYSDILFNTVNKGVTTIPELNSSLANVIPTAASMKIPFEEVTAAIATMTKQGIPTAQATTQIRQAMVELSKPGETLANVMKKAGVSLKSIKEEGFQVSLEKIGIAMANAGQSATQVFGSVEAANAVLALSGENAKGYADILATYLTDAAGSTQRAFDVANTGIGVQIQGIMNKIEAVAFKAFGAVGDGVTILLGAANQIAPLAMTFAGLGSIIPDGAIGNVKQYASMIVNFLVPGLVTHDIQTKKAILNTSALSRL